MRFHSTLPNDLHCEGSRQHARVGKILTDRATQGTHGPRGHLHGATAPEECVGYKPLEREALEFLHRELTTSLAILFLLEGNFQF